MLSYVTGQGVLYISNNYSASLYLDCLTQKMKSLLSSEISGVPCLMTQIASQNHQQVGVIGMVIINFQFDSSWLL